MEYEKLVEGNYDEFVSDLKVAFFDVTARNQAIMDQIEVALSHEEDQDRINSLQTLWADFHDAVKGCVSGANLIATSVEQLDNCSSRFASLMGKKNQKTKKEVIENKEAIQEPVVELPAEAIVDIPEETVNMDIDDTVPPVIEEETDLNAVELPPVEKMEFSSPKENIVPVEVGEAIADPIKSVPPIPDVPVVENTPAIVEPTLVVPAETAPIVSAPVELANTAPVVSIPATSPTAVDVVEVPTPEIISTIVPEASTPIVVPPVTIPAQEAIVVPEMSVPVVSAPVQAKSAVVAETSVPVVTASTAVSLEPIVPEPTIESVPAIVEATTEVPPVITATEIVDAPSIVSSTPVPEIPAASESSIVESPQTVGSVIKEETPVVTEVASEVPEITEKVVEAPTPALVLEPIKEEVPKVATEIDSAKIEESTPTALLPTIEEKTDVVLEEKKETPIIPFPQEENKMEITPEKKNLGVLDLEPVEEKTASAEVKNLLTFVKKSSLEDKAILVTKNQAQKLRYSKDLQSALIRSIHPTPESSVETEEVTEAQLEDMMNQLSSLYEQGKMDEAEKMSEQISVLSKKLKPAA